MDNTERISKISKEVLNFARNTLLLNLRFLDSALSRLGPTESESLPFGTDGRHLVYNPKYLLKRYANSSNQTVRDYLHTLLHCIFRHNFVDPYINHELWNLSCDVAVESIINSLDVNSIKLDGLSNQFSESYRLEQATGSLTAEKLYRYFLDHPQSSKDIARLSELYHTDDHSLWYMSNDERATVTGNNNDVSNQLNIGSEEDWKNISERIQVDMETFSKNQGYRTGSLMQNLRAVNREKYDYTAFLKKFAIIGEAMRVNDDEFDYIFYTYGLQLYKNMPLIEPLEYKEVKRIREFVIAIDTSGSVAGELVQTFLQKTYNILKQSESFFSKINVHIIQCDADIQEHVKITSQEEFDNYLATIVIKGLGGTDFRPVFDVVNTLINNKEFDNLKGLIYFTDGFGTFPNKKPPYETAFVFINDGFNNLDVPPWAIRIILQKDEI